MDLFSVKKTWNVFKVSKEPKEPVIYAQVRKKNLVRETSEFCGIPRYAVYAYNKNSRMVVKRSE